MFAYVPPAPKLKFQAGLGAEYLLSSRFGIKAYVDYNHVFSDDLDGLVAGKREDQYYEFGAGIHFYFGNKQGFME